MASARILGKEVDGVLKGTEPFSLLPPGDCIASIAVIECGVEVGVMATLTIRGLDPVTHARLRVEAARHGRSMEAEVRAILQERLTPRVAESGLGTRIRARFHGLEGELELPDRAGEAPRAADFGL